MTLLHWALISFIVSVVAAILGFGGIARGAARIARFLFGIFLVLAIIFLIFHLL